MKNLQLVQSARFGEIQADIYSDSNDMYMTINQVAECLGYADKKSVENLIDRNPYLKNGEFSYIQKVPLKAGGTQNTRTFTEDGIYEVTMLSSQPKAKEFRAWIRKVLKGIRKGELKVIPTRRSLGEVNSAARIITQTLKEAGMSPQFRAVAIQSLYAPVGVEIPLIGVTVDKRTYDATAIAKALGLFSKSGNPHGQAVSAIISQLEVDAGEKELVPFQNQSSGHAGVNIQYAQSVVDKVSSWLTRNGYPPEVWSNGRSYRVSYQEASA